MEFYVKKFKLFLIFFIILFSNKSYSVDPEDIVASQVNYAYANYLGTGFYTAADRTVQVYHLPFRYTLRDTSENKAGLRFRLPVTIGFLGYGRIPWKYASFPSPRRSLPLHRQPASLYLHAGRKKREDTPGLSFLAGRLYAPVGFTAFYQFINNSRIGQSSGITYLVGNSFSNFA